MPSTPRVSVGLPVYNGETYLAETLDSLLGQTYTDFELLISDNASTDGTADICAAYQRQDPRVRFFRQSQNIGAAPNHNFVIHQSSGEFFKWASADDLYARDLLRRCVNALDEFPGVVLANSWTAMIDPSSSVFEAVEYPLDTASPAPSERFRSVLYGGPGSDNHGSLIRLDVLRRTPLLGSYHFPERTLFAELALLGPFLHLPDWLQFRRDHPGAAYRTCRTVRARCANLDPRRADRLRNPPARLYGEFVWGFISAIHRAPIEAAERRRCYQSLVHWAVDKSGVTAGRVLRGGELPLEQPAEGEPPSLSVDMVVARRNPHGA